MKYLIIPMMMVVGCATSNQEIEFKPLPPEKLHDLLHKESYKYLACAGCNKCKNVLWAYTSVTKKDYEQKDFN